MFWLKSYAKMSGIQRTSKWTATQLTNFNFRFKRGTWLFSSEKTLDPIYRYPLSTSPNITWCSRTQCRFNLKSKEPWWYHARVVDLHAKTSIAVKLDCLRASKSCGSKIVTSYSRANKQPSGCWLPPSLEAKSKTLLTLSSLRSTLMMTVLHL